MKITRSIYKVSIISLIIFFLVSFLARLNLIHENKSIFLEWELTTINSACIVIRLILDWKSLFFLTTVSIISLFILLYRVYYIEGDKNFKRFTLILLSFVLSIILLIISPNIIRLMLGWDGLGLTSYALVIFYQNEYSANSGIITILSNRVGDSTLLLSIGWLGYIGSYNFIFYNHLDRLIVFLIIVRAFTKRAQMPFSAWLPAAMAAPTPVSALVHSSTLVTAGVFLIIRFTPIMKNREILLIAFLVGVITILIAGWRANFETDLKKVVALSTLSQLGLMFITLGLGQDLLAIFHLLIHALFKSALFMCAGFIIHNTQRRQDRRFIGSINFSSPTLGLVFGVTNLSLCGFPFLTGFFSKDIILEHSFRVFLGNFIFVAMVLATGLTISYSLRAIYITSRINRKAAPVKFSSDFNTELLVRTALLFLLSITGGYLLSWWIVNKGFVFSMTVSEKFSILFILSTIASLILFLIRQHFNPTLGIKAHISTLITFLPIITKTPLVVLALFLGKTNLNIGDKGWLELAGPASATRKLAIARFKLHSSNNLVAVTQYILTRLGIIVLVACLC